MRQKLTVALVLIAALMLTAACSSAVTPTGASATPAVNVARGGILHVIVKRPPSLLDPQQASAWEDMVATDGVYSGLLREDPANPSQIIGDLAQRWEFIDNGAKIRFHLRQGVTWHDRKPFTADDVVYSMSRWLDPKFVSARSGPLVRAAVKGATAVDSHTVDVQLTSPPRVSNLAVFASPFVKIVPKHILANGGDLSKTPIGTGPFLLQSTDDIRTVWTRNPNYWLTAPDGKPYPYLDGVEQKVMSDPSAILAALRVGQIDVLPSVSALLVDQVQQALTANPNLTGVRGPNALPTFLLLRAEIPPFDDPNVRQAVYLGINRQDYRARVNGGAGVFGILDPRIYPTFAVDVSNEPGWRTSHEQDLAQGRSLLRASGKADMPVELFSISITGDDLLVMKANLEAIGFTKVTTKLVTDPVSNLQYRNAGAYSALIMGGGPPINDPSLVMQINYLPEGTWGSKIGYKTPYEDPLIRRLFNESSSATIDPQKRVELVQQFQRHILTGTTPWVPLYWGDKLQAAKKSVHGYVSGPTVFSGNTYDRVWLSQ